MEAAEGCLTQTEELLGNNIAQADKFVELCSPDDAADHIYYHTAPEPPNGREAFTKEETLAMLPYAHIETDGAGGLSLRRTAHNFLAQSGQMVVTIAIHVPDDAGLQNDAERNRYAMNRIGSIIKTNVGGTFGLAERNEEAGFLTVNDVTVDFLGPAPEIDRLSQDIDRYYAQLTVTYGVEE